ncbi:MAG: hypothetical protein Fur0023_11470 [Bacteroidia bacterium]
MKLAVIDMGTNTFNLLIAECLNGDFRVVYSDKQPVKLGQKSAEQHFIDSEGIRRISRVLELYKAQIEKHSVDEVLALATSSIRTANNQKEVLDFVREKFQIPVQIIDGLREAELISIANQYAIRQCMKEQHYPALIMDIGGGSTEFIITSPNSVLWKKSFLIGMSRLIDEIRPHDPVQSSDIERIHLYLDSILEPLIIQISQHRPKTLVGSSGVFDSVVEMIEANIHPLKKTNSCCFVNKEDFDSIYRQILPLAYQDRLAFKGLIEMRADMIVISLILIDYVLKKYNPENFVVSFYSLKEGAVIEKMRNTH